MVISSPPESATGPYQVLMVDPPWPGEGHFDTDGRGATRTVADSAQRRAMPYKTVDMEGIGHLLDNGVFAQAAPRHVVFLWCTERGLTDAERLMTERGYRLHTRIVWDKVAGCFIGTVQRSHEYMGWWHKGGLLPIAPAAVGRHHTVVRETRRGNSRKPEAAYRLVAALYPDARRLDAFTREYRPGWDGFGDQRDHFTPLLAPLRAGQEAYG